MPTKDTSVCESVVESEKSAWFILRKFPKQQEGYLTILQRHDHSSNCGRKGGGFPETKFQETLTVSHIGRDYLNYHGIQRLVTVSEHPTTRRLAS
jgi:hypothetical protein